MKSLHALLRRRLSAWANRAPILLVLTLFTLGIVFWGAFNTALETTNRESFCISCHEMRDNVFPLPEISSPQQRLRRQRLLPRLPRSPRLVRHGHPQNQRNP